MPAPVFILFLQKAVEWEITIFVGGLLVIITYGLLTRRINTKNLLYGTKRNGQRYFSPERVQMLVSTLAVALYYLHSVMLSANTGQFPPFPHGMLQFLGASNGVYLAGKGLMTLKMPGQDS
jgi:hypothetical protein